MISKVNTGGTNLVNKTLRLMKPWDYFIITAVIMASFVPYLLFDTNNDENNNRESSRCNCSC